MNKSVLTFLGKDSGFGKNNNSAYVEESNNLYIIDCGYSVFNILKENFDFNKYTNIYIIITHLHNDHAGSLSQLILYLWFIYNKKVTVVSNCCEILNYLNITGVPPKSYILKNKLKNLKFIETNHTEYLDAYGFFATFNNKKIIYTGDTNTLKPFNLFLNKINELYIDVSKNGGAHLKIEDIIDTLYNLNKTGISIYPMHLDDKTYINKIINKKFNI